MSETYVDLAYVECPECGREYRAHGLWHSRQYDGPGWFEIDPDERTCEECREKAVETPTVAAEGGGLAPEEPAPFQGNVRTDDSRAG